MDTPIDQVAQLSEERRRMLAVFVEVLAEIGDASRVSEAEAMAAVTAFAKTLVGRAGELTVLAAPDGMVDPVGWVPFALQVKLASIVVHCDEALSDGGHVFDVEAIRGLTHDPEVTEFVDNMDPAFLPVKRS